MASSLLICRERPVWTPGTLCLGQCLMCSVFLVDVDKTRDKVRGKGTVDRKGSKKSGREREMDRQTDRQESYSFDPCSGVRRGRSCRQAARCACAILGLHPRNFASGCLACLRDKEFFNKQGGQSSSLHPDTSPFHISSSPSRPALPKAGACASQTTPSHLGFICPFLMGETLSGRQASLGVAMVMAMMSLGSKSNCKSQSGTALGWEGC